jgi:hypothetical protein
MTGQPEPVPATVTTPATPARRSIGGPLSGSDDPQITPGDGQVWRCECGERGCTA